MSIKCDPYVSAQSSPTCRERLYELGSARELLSNSVTAVCINPTRVVRVIAAYESGSRTRLCALRHRKCESRHTRREWRTARPAGHTARCAVSMVQDLSGVSRSTRICNAMCAQCCTDPHHTMTHEQTRRKARTHAHSTHMHHTTSHKVQVSATAQSWPCLLDVLVRVPYPVAILQPQPAACIKEACARHPPHASIQKGNVN